MHNWTTQGYKTSTHHYDTAILVPEKMSINVNGFARYKWMESLETWEAYGWVYWCGNLWVGDAITAHFSDRFITLSLPRVLSDHGLLYPLFYCSDRAGLLKSSPDRGFIFRCKYNNFILMKITSFNFLCFNNINENSFLNVK